MLQKFLDFSLASFVASVNYNVFYFIVIPVATICLFAFVIRLFRGVF